MMVPGKKVDNILMKYVISYYVFGFKSHSTGFWYNILTLSLKSEEG